MGNGERRRNNDNSNGSGSLLFVSLAVLSAHLHGCSPLQKNIKRILKHKNKTSSLLPSPALP